MSTIAEQQSLFQKNLFYVVVCYVIATYLAFSIHFVDILVIRFLRLPLLAFFLIYLYRQVPTSLFDEGDNYKWLKRLFLFIIIYLVFNSVTGINISNSLLYFVWLIISLAFFSSLLFKLNNGTSSAMIIYSVALGFALPGLLFICVSLIGGYVLGLPSYFDVGLDFAAGSGETKEFGGIFGNANTLAMVTFTTFSSVLILFAYQSVREHIYYLYKLAFAVLLISLLGLQVHIGSRTGIACTALTAILYLTFYKRNAYYLLFLLLPVIYVVASNPAVITDSINTNDFEKKRKFGNRTELIEDAFRISEKMDYLGVGYANQRIARERYSVTKQFTKRGELHFHNTFLALWIELGYVGALLFLVPILLLIIKAVNFVIFRRFRYREQVILLLTTAIPIMLFGMAEDSINMAGSPVFSYFWIFFILIALLLDNSYPIDENDSLF